LFGFGSIWKESAEEQLKALSSVSDSGYPGLASGMARALPIWQYVPPVPVPYDPFPVAPAKPLPKVVVSAKCDYCGTCDESGLKENCRNCGAPIEQPQVTSIFPAIALLGGLSLLMMTKR